MKWCSRSTIVNHDQTVNWMQSVETVENGQCTENVKKHWRVGLDDPCGCLPI